MVQTINTLDVDYQADILSAIVHQDEANSRQLIFTLTKQEEPITIPQDTTAKCFFLKPDETTVVTDCQIINNKIVLTFTEQMTASAGMALAQIFFTNADDSSVLKSVKFRVMIDKNIISNSEIISTSEWESLTKQLLILDNYSGRLINIEEYIKEFSSALSTNNIEIQQLKSNKLGRNESGSITMNLLSQEVKTAIAGGSVAVVGADCVDYYNITGDLRDLLLTKTFVADYVSHIDKAAAMTSSDDINTIRIYNYANGAIPSGVIKSIELDVASGETYVISGSKGYGSQLPNPDNSTKPIIFPGIVYAQLNADGTYLYIDEIDADNLDTIVENGTFVSIPDSCNKLFINCTGSSNPVITKIEFTGKKRLDTVTVNEEKINQLENTTTSITDTLTLVTSENLFNPNDAIMANVSATGAITSSSGNYLTGYIPIAEGEELDTYRLNSTGLVYSYTTTRILTYDSDKNMVDVITPTSRAYTATEGICYIRYCITAANYESFMVIKGSTIPTAYVEYFEPYYIINVGNIADFTSTVNRMSCVKVSKIGDTITITARKANYVFKKCTSTTTNVDTWRLYSGDLVDDSGNLHNMWINTDAEGPIKISGEDDFVGGYHGDEHMTAIRAFADGVEIDLSADFADLYFGKLEIYVSSDIYHCNTSDLADTIAFKRNKKLVFTHNKVNVSNYYVAQEDLVVNMACAGLFQCFKSDNNSTSEDDRIITSYSCNTDLLPYDAVLGNTGTVPSSSTTMTEAVFDTNYGCITVKNIRSSEQKYGAFFVDYPNQNRIKVYFNTISNDTAVQSGEGIFGEFEWTID